MFFFTLKVVGKSSWQMINMSKTSVHSNEHDALPRFAFWLEGEERKFHFALAQWPACCVVISKCSLHSMLIPPPGCLSSATQFLNLEAAFSGPYLTLISPFLTLTYATSGSSALKARPHGWTCCSRDSERGPNHALTAEEAWKGSGKLKMEEVIKTDSNIFITQVDKNIWVISNCRKFNHTLSNRFKMIRKLSKIPSSIAICIYDMTY